MKLLSFVIPCYRSGDTIEKVINEIKEVVSQRKEYDYEIVCVNDCSPDNVYNVLLDLAYTDKKIKVINFTRNMGKHSAVMAGYSVVNGDIIVNLDDDFQCPTNELWKLVDPVENDECDVATAEYIVKKESFIKRAGSNVNLRMTESLLDKPKGLRIDNFNVMKRFVVDEIIKYKNPYPFLEGLILRVTRNIKAVLMEQRERGDSNSSGFTLKKSLSLIMNGFTAFSVKPLRISSFCGVAFAIIGFIYGLVIVIRKILIPEVQMGYSSMMAVMLFSLGLIMIMLGLIGEYIGRIYICLNASPQYVIKNTVNVVNTDSERE